MTSRAVRFLMTLTLMSWVWGCKKTDASPGAAEADDAEPVAEASPPSEADQAPASSEPTLDNAPGGDTPAETAPESPVSAEKPDDVFSVRLETTKGDIIIDVHRDWAPLGAERFHELVRAGFYDDVAFFRVMEGFMAQTGISGQPKLNAKWGKKTIRDEPARKHNLRGMITFAKAGPDSRTTQFFINLVDNTQLDAMGFAPFGKVRDMAAVDALYTGYGDGPPSGKGPDQQRIKQKGNGFLKKKFPKLDYIIAATIIE
jgi:peptidyl-prolyl cis-trans isomerase A (cyclophilin A)